MAGWGIRHSAARLKLRNPSRPPTNHQGLVQLKALEVVTAISHIHSFSLSAIFR